MWLSISLYLSVLYLSVGYPQFKDVVPNGDRLPHPCKHNYIWHGIGHMADKGGGALNDFGKDFLRLGKTWNKALCQLDSDKDGMTNGEELGDPYCTWVHGRRPERLDKLTHPGVCDPWDKEVCKKSNHWVNCNIDEFKCESIYGDGVKNITLRMPKTKVPNEETNYMCTVFDLPRDDDYHIIATKPHIDNEIVMHHMLLFGCPDEERVMKMTTNIPKTCTMGNTGCTDIIGSWTVGLSGECAPPQFGYRIGIKGYKRVVLQAHWNNPELKSDYVDSSGLILYYTSKLRLYDAGVLMVGSIQFVLPPGRPEVTVVGTCSEGCSKERINGSIYVTSAMNHMHYLGRKQKIEIFRGGQKVQDITNEDSYSYDNPIRHNFADPVEIRAGDEVKTTCVFRTTSRVNYTANGQGTNDEMCLGFLTFFPQQNVERKVCASWKSIPFCDVSKPIVRGCTLQHFMNISHPEFVDMREAVMNHCSTSSCFDGCKDQMEIIKMHPCMNGDVGEYVRYRLMRLKDFRIYEFYRGLDSCSQHIELQDKDIVNASRKYVLAMRGGAMLGTVVVLINYFLCSQ